MIEEIRKNKPEGATHWRAGTYYRKANPEEWYYWEDGDWRFTSYVNKFIMELSKI